MAKAKPVDCDIVICGGGMIGTSLALALSPLDLDIVVVEAVARAAEGQPSFDDRSTALSRSTQRAYEAMGLWEQVAANSTRIRQIHVSDRGRFGFAHIDAAEQGVEALGYVVINRVLGKVLNEALAAADNVTLHCPMSVTDIRSADENALVVAEGDSGEQSFRCKLVVAADGANSTARNLVGIGSSREAYDQWAVIGNVLPDLAPGERAFERFTERGALAMLPVAEHRSAFVWMQPEADAKQRLTQDDDEFLHDLQQIFGMRLGRFSRVGKRAAYPLALSRANQLVADRAVVVGNAAHGLHPIAAQGFNLGMRDVAALGDCIADAIAGENGDPGSTRVLERYAEWRRRRPAKTRRFHARPRTAVQRWPASGALGEESGHVRFRFRPRGPHAVCAPHDGTGRPVAAPVARSAVIVKREYKIVVVGAGMVGMTAAALLSRTRDSRISVSVVDAGERPAFDESADVQLRVSAISPGSAALLAEIGAWENVLTTRASPYVGMQVWDHSGAPEGPETLVFNAADFAVPALGTIVENQLVRTALLRELEREGVDVRFGVKIDSLDTTGPYPVLLLDSGQKIAADLVIAADGARSFVRDAVGIGTTELRHEQEAVVTHLRPEVPHRGIALQRFLPQGPIGMLPLDDGRVSIVWSTTSEEAQAALKLDDAALGEKISEISGGALGNTASRPARAALFRWSRGMPSVMSIAASR